MKLIRVSLALAIVGALAGLAYVGQQSEDSGAKMVGAAQKFLDSLSADEKKIAQFDFGDKERTNWNFVPLQDKNKKATRKGLPLVSMNAEQKKAALELLRTGTSESGYATAVEIMGLEAILRDQETKGAMVRNPEWYFVTIFGTPGRDGKWGWRFEGHHLSINVTLNGADVVSATPFFFGANPAEYKSGDKKGRQVLEPAQKLAANLFKSLDAAQKQAAEKKDPFPEPGQKEPAPKVGAPVGIAAAKMTKDQKDTLLKLLEHYTGRLPKDVGQREWKDIMDAGIDNVHFAFQGSPEEGKGRSYRVQGPTFVIEFLNIQADSAGNAANHIHSSERRIKGDFGL
jgi:hypothetical protein